MNAHLLLFEKKLRYKKVHFSQFLKDPLQFIKNNPALVASVVLKKIYFHGICALSKEYIKFHAFLCVRSKKNFLRVKNVKKTKSHAS